MRAEGTNPTRSIRKVKEQERNRTLAPSEAEALFASLDVATDLFVREAILFLADTGWRCGEVLALQWEYIDFERGAVTLPHTKAGPQIRHLADTTMEQLARLPRINGNGYVFAGPSGAMSYKMLYTNFRNVCHAAGLKDVRLHDLRRSAATSAASAGSSAFALVPLEIGARCPIGSNQGSSGSPPRYLGD